MLWNNGREVRVAMQSRDDQTVIARKSPVRQSKTPPSGWPGQVKKLGGVSLCLNVQRGVPSLAGVSSWGLRIPNTLANG